MRHATKVLWAVIAMIAIPFLYVLSLGPLAALVFREIVSPVIWAHYLYPLHFLGIDEDGNMIGHVLNEYISLWLPQ